MCSLGVEFPLLIIDKMHTSVWKLRRGGRLATLFLQIYNHFLFFSFCFLAHSVHSIFNASLVFIERLKKKEKKKKQPHHHYFRSRYLKSFQIESTWLWSRWLVKWAFLFRFHGVAVKHPNRLLIIPLSLNNGLLLALILNMNYITVLHCAWADYKPNKQP